MLKFFSSVFVKPLMDLIPVWHGDDTGPKFYIPSPFLCMTLEVKVIYLKFLCKCFVFKVIFCKISVGFDSWLA